MAIPVATTTVKLWRRDPDEAATADPWETPAGAVFVLADEGVRATIAVGNGTQAGRTVGPGDSELVQFTMQCDPCGLSYLDEVEDEITGARYRVEWAITTPGLFGALASDTAGLSTRKGS